MTTSQIVAQSTTELTLAHIMLNLDAPPKPPMLPTDPADAVSECRNYLDRCQRLLSEARTTLDRESAELWVWNAENQLARWQAALSRQAVRI